MLSDKDKKQLAGASARFYLVAMVTLVTVMLIFVAGCIQNLYLAKIIGSVEGYGIVDIARFWAIGVDIKETYSGVYVTAVNRFGLAFLNLGTVAVLAICIWGVYTIRQRNIRIVQALKDSGAW
jgi:hypothetical protein